MPLIQNQQLSIRDTKMKTRSNLIKLIAVLLFSNTAVAFDFDDSKKSHLAIQLQGYALSCRASIPLGFKKAFDASINSDFSDIGQWTIALVAALENANSEFEKNGPDFKERVCKFVATKLNTFK